MFLSFHRRQGSVGVVDWPQPTAKYTQSCLLSGHLSPPWLGKLNTLSTARWMILSFFQLESVNKGPCLCKYAQASMDVGACLDALPVLAILCVYLRVCISAAYFWQSGHSRTPPMWIVHTEAMHWNSSTHTCTGFQNHLRNFSTLVRLTKKWVSLSPSVS